MKHIIKLTLTTISLAMASYVSGQVSFGQPQCINNNWQFSLNIDGANAETKPDINTKWTNINLPHDWSVKQQLSPSLASCTGFLPGGIGWYKKEIEVASNLSDKKIYLYFEGVYNRSKVFVNGNLLGYRPNGYASFMYDATPYINFGKTNTIEVQVNHSQSADSRWYTGSGIYRNVWMIVANPTHIEQWGTYASTKTANKQRATIRYSINIENGANRLEKLQVVNQLIAPNGKQISQTKNSTTIQPQKRGRIECEFNVKQPQLWSFETPKLYSIRTTIYSNGQAIDSATTQTGIRIISFDPNRGIFLNGVNTKIKGVCLHHDAGVLGSTVPREVWEDRLQTLKSIGCNAIRMSHNPQAPVLYQLCDSLGLLVLDEAFDEWEFAKRKWISGWNVGTPGYQGSFDFFEEWSNRDIADMVCRDRNHPSIFAWSIGNEVDYPNDPYSHPVLEGSSISQPMFGGYKTNSPDAMRLGDIAKRLAAQVRANDPYRPVTAALAGVVMSNETEYPGALDITGYNYTEDRYAIDHKKYPNRVIFGSENRHDMDAWKAVRDNEYIFGQFLWTGIDYLGESGAWPARGFYSGLIGFDGRIKPRGLFRQALWSDKPTIHIGTYPAPANNYQSMDAWPVWNYSDKQNIRVVCYTNAAQAKLLLNGTQVGETKPYNDKSGIISWDIPFEAGKLEAVAIDKNGKEIARNFIQTSGRPTQITASVNKKTINKNGGVAIVKLQLTDSNGIAVATADDMIECNITGPAKLLGLEAGNNCDMTDYTDNKQRAFNGQIVAYIQADGKADNINIKFSAPWLKDTDVTIVAE